jgi:branched-chain amino acid transport system permease protein
MELLVQQLANGIMTGSIYVLMAIGIVISLNVLRVVNLAHGQAIMLGSFFTFYLTGVYGLNLFLTLIIIFIAVGIIYIGIERVVLHTVRQKKIPMLVASTALLGVALTIDEIARRLWGVETKMILAGFGSQSIVIGGVYFTVLRLTIFLTSLFGIALLLLFIYRTKIGKSLRAIAQDVEVSALVGINVNSGMRVGFFISAGLGAVAGALMAQMVPIYFNMGLPIMFRSAAIVVVGGITSISGCLVAGFILAMGEALVIGYFGAEYRDLFFFGALVLILLVRPAGLMGKEIVRE